MDITRIDWRKTQDIFAPEKDSFLERSKKTLRKYPHVEESLRILAGFGVVSLVLLMPGLSKVIAADLRNKERQRYRRMWQRLRERKLVKIKETSAGQVVEITQAGFKKALRFKIEEMKIKQPKRWDKHWRIVIFDVPEKKKRARDGFRHYLNNLGFEMLNKSVFVHPYPCFDEVEFLRQISGIGKEVTYIVASSVETSKDLRKHFDLPDKS